MDDAPTPARHRVRLGAEADERLRNSGLAEQLGFALRVAQAAVWSDLTGTLRPFGLRPQQYAALLIVAANPGCRQQEVASALGIQRPNMVALLDELAERGLVRREVKPGDRRSYALSVTGAGESLLNEAERAHDAHRARIAAAIGPLGERDFLAALERLARLDPAP